MGGSFMALINEEKLEVSSAHEKTTSEGKLSPALRVVMMKGNFQFDRELSALSLKYLQELNKP